jgi:parallel beta-helix repeat protein
LSQSLGNANAYILVNGVLSAIGTNANPIYINGGIGGVSFIGPAYYSSITFSISSTGWNDATGSGSIIENAILNLTEIDTSSSVKISNDIIINGEMSILGGSPLIYGNSISSLVYIKGGNCSVSNNQIASGFILYSGEDGGEGATITNNVISDAQSVSGFRDGIWFSGEASGHVLIENNLISDNYYGIQIFSPNVDIMPTTLTIQNNTITNNNVGISVSNSYMPTIIENNLQNNTLNIQLTTDYSGHSKDVDASNNWWGTTDTQAINQTIYDFKDDFTLGVVTFVPFLTAPNPEAMSNLNAPIPTPTSTQSPSQSSTTTSTSTPTSSSSPSASQSQQSTASLPLELIVAAVVIVIIAVAIGAFLLGKRTGQK